MKPWNCEVWGSVCVDWWSTSLHNSSAALKMTDVEKGHTSQLKLVVGILLLQTLKKKLYVVHNCLAHCLYISRHSDNTSKGVKKQRLISIELIKKVCHNRYFLVSFLFYKRIYLLGLYHKYFIASTFKICSFSKLFYCP